MCIDYLSFQSETFSAISYNPIFKDISFNILLVIGILELLLNLVSFHGIMKKQNLNVILNCQTRLINKYLSKVLQFIFLTNDVKLKFNLINQLDTDYVMVKYKAISAIANTIKNCISRKICI